MSEENIALTDIAQKIALKLGETGRVPLTTIERVVKFLGEERAMGLLDETLRVESDGGMLTEDGSRRRTIGGVFFKLAKDKTTPRERALIFNPPQARKKAKPHTPWKEIQPLAIEVLKSSPGKALIVKTTIIGRPDRIVEKDKVVLTSMPGGQAPGLPRGLPQPPPEPTIYLIFMAIKQWRKVKDSIDQNPDDKLIIEGYPIFDKRIGKKGTMTIYAQSITTMLIQRARREAQQTATAQA